MIRRIILFILLFLIPLPQELRAELEAYGTLECMGIVADLPVGATHEQIGEVQVELERDGLWRRVPRQMGGIV